MDEKIKKMVEDTLKYEPNADKAVLGFIYEFIWHSGKNEEDVELTRKKFRAGYCYYFATMLKAAFERGEIVWCAPYGHIAWQDENEVVYDIEGICDSDCDYFIPISYIKEGIDDFKHVPGVSFDASEKYICDAINKYKKDKNL